MQSVSTRLSNPVYSRAIQSSETSKSSATSLTITFINPNYDVTASYEDHDVNYAVTGLYEDYDVYVEIEQRRGSYDLDDFAQSNYSKWDILVAYNSLRYMGAGVKVDARHASLLDHLQQLRGELSLEEIIHLLRCIKNLGASSVSEAILNELAIHINRYDLRYIHLKEQNQKATNEIRLAEAILNLSALIQSNFIPAVLVVRVMAIKLNCAIDNKSLRQINGVRDNIMSLVLRAQRKERGVTIMDLHGMSHALASLVMEEFVNDLVENRIRTDSVLLIYGKGLHREDGRNVMGEIKRLAFSKHLAYLETVWRFEFDPDDGYLKMERLSLSVTCNTRELELNGILTKRRFQTRHLNESKTTTNEILLVQVDLPYSRVPTASAHRANRSPDDNNNRRQLNTKRSPAGDIEFRPAKYQRGEVEAVAR